MLQTIQNKTSWSKWHKRLHQRLKNNNSLLPSNSTLLLAISGGQDSMALLKLINDLKRLYDWEIEVWHGDHNWHENSEQINVEDIEAMEEEIRDLENEHSDVQNEPGDGDRNEKLLEMQKKLKQS